MKVLVAYDGTIQAKDALRYGVQKVRENGGELVALHVFNSNIFIGYDSHPRAQEMARAEASWHVEEARTIIREEGKGIKAAITLAEGDPAEETVDYARAEKVDILLCPPKYKSIIKRYKKALSEEGKGTFEDTVLDEARKVRMSVVSVR